MSGVWPKITLTGADERTTLESMSQLLLLDPRVELGVLCSWNPEGRHRYPSLDSIRVLTSFAGERCAVHVCGSKARLALREGLLNDIVSPVGRIQINGRISAEEVANFCTMFPRQQIITQWRPTCSVNLDGLPSNHQILVDDSGGRGVLPEQWLRPRTLAIVGFAGGLNPENLAVELPKIKQVAAGLWWVDMESGLRDRYDWFDVEKAKEAVGVFQRLIPLEGTPCPTSAS